ncbi:MAG: serine/threonine-protein kinase, partial [Planctomycetota bacterium]|nr:serine/threonine-protein kinase [Planctomycetota bacterium]
MMDERDDSPDSLIVEGDGLLDQILDRLRSGESPDAESLAAEFPGLADEIPQLVRLVGFVHGASQEIQPMHDLDGQLALGLQPTAGEYLVEELISRGGMGAVYRARHGELDRPVAIKLLESDRAKGSQGRARFQREARNASLLSHGHIVPIYSVGEYQGTPYYAMAFVNGPTLAQIARERSNSKQPLDAAFLRKATGWVRDIATALAHAHGHGVIHRDVEPSNILTDTAGTAYLADFGLARAVSDVTLTQPGRLVGTLRYMSPEQARGGGALDERTDVYSLGATLYGLLAGQPMFDKTEREALLHQILAGDPPALRKRQPTIPADLATIVHKAVAKRPEDRYQSATLLAQDLDNFLGDRAIQARPPTLKEHFQRLDRRNKRLLRGALVAVALIFLLAGVATIQALRIAGDRDRIAEESERATRAKNFLVGVLFKANPKSGSSARDLDALLDTVSVGLRDEFQEDPATEAEIRFRLGDVYSTRSRFEEADQQFELAMDRGRLAFGPGDPWVLQISLVRIAQLNLRGQFAKSLDLLEEIPKAAQAEHDP